MRRTRPILVIAVAIVATVGIGSAQAKPPWASGPAGQADGEAHRAGPRVDVVIHLGSHFGDRERRVVRHHYEEAFRGGHCPPGLAKKRNGCMPPGQARQWRLGYRLPEGLVYHALSPRLRVEIGEAPRGYEYVRVASDILLIAVGTGLVVDAIEDLGRL